MKIAAQTDDIMRAMIAVIQNNSMLPPPFDGNRAGAALLQGVAA